MQFRSKKCAATLVILSLAKASTAHAGNYTLDSTSSITLTHIGDLGNAATQYTIPGASLTQLTTTVPNQESWVTYTGGAIPTASPPSYQLNDVFTYPNSETENTSTSTGTGAVYADTTNNNMFVGLKAGTGIIQNDAGQNLTKDSVLNAHINASWTLNSAFPTSPEFPGISYQLPIAGTAGINGSAHFIVSLAFYDITVSASPIGSINIDQTYSGGASGMTFSQLFSGTALLDNGGTLPVNSHLQLVGDITFKAKNQDSPSCFSLTSDSEFGAFDSVSDPVPLPPVAWTFVTLLGGVASFHGLKRVRAASII